MDDFIKKIEKLQTLYKRVALSMENSKYVYENASYPGFHILSYNESFGKDINGNDVLERFFITIVDYDDIYSLVFQTRSLVISSVFSEMFDGKIDKRDDATTFSSELIRYMNQENIGFYKSGNNILYLTHVVESRLNIKERYIYDIYKYFGTNLTEKLVYIANNKENFNTNRINKFQNSIIKYVKEKNIKQVPDIMERNVTMSNYIFFNNLKDIIYDAQNGGDTNKIDFLLYPNSTDYFSYMNKEADDFEYNAPDINQSVKKWIKEDTEILINETTLGHMMNKLEKHINTLLFTLDHENEIINDPLNEKYIDEKLSQYLIKKVKNNLENYDKLSNVKNLLNTFKKNISQEFFKKDDEVREFKIIIIKWLNTMFKYYISEFDKHDIKEIIHHHRLKKRYEILRSINFKKNFPKLPTIGVEELKQRKPKKVFEPFRPKSYKRLTHDQINKLSIREKVDYYRNLDNNVELWKIYNEKLEEHANYIFELERWKGRMRTLLRENKRIYKRLINKYEKDQKEINKQIKIQQKKIENAKEELIKQQKIQNEMKIDYNDITEKLKTELINIVSEYKVENIENKDVDIENFFMNI